MCGHGVCESRRYLRGALMCANDGLRPSGLLFKVIAAALLCLIALWVWDRTRPRSAEMSEDPADTLGISGNAPVPELAPLVGNEPNPVARAAKVDMPQTAVSAAESASQENKWWRPGREHRYDDVADVFVRQPLDYSPDTPSRLGNSIGFALFDLERVSDMVRTATTPESEVAMAKGRALTKEEWHAARQVLQLFFDETTPVVDAILSGDMSTTAGARLIAARRTDLNKELRDAMGLGPKQFYQIWPHLKHAPKFAE